MYVKQKFNILGKKMYDILVILVDFLWKFSMIQADFLLPGSVSWPDRNGSKRIRITEININIFRG